MFKYLILGAVLFVCLIFGLQLYTHNWNLSNAVQPIISFVKPTVSDWAERGATYAKENPIQAISGAVGAVSGLGIIGSKLYGWRQKKNQETESLKNTLYTSQSEASTVINQQQQKIGELEEEVKKFENMPKSLEEAQRMYDKVISEKDKMESDLRSQITALNEIVKQLKAETILEKVVIK